MKILLISSRKLFNIFFVSRKVVSLKYYWIMDEFTENYLKLFGFDHLVNRFKWYIIIKIKIKIVIFYFLV